LLKEVELFEEGGDREHQSKVDHDLEMSDEE